MRRISSELDSKIRNYIILQVGWQRSMSLLLADDLLRLLDIVVEPENLRCMKLKRGKNLYQIYNFRKLEITFFFDRIC